MQQTAFPVIDPVATGENIVRLRKARGLTVRDLQTYFGFEEPQAIYKWQWGKSLPTVDNLYALSALLDVSMDEILVSARPKLNIIKCEQQANACCSVLYWAGTAGYGRNLRQLRVFFQSYTGCLIKPGVFYRKTIKMRNEVHELSKYKNLCT